MHENLSKGDWSETVVQDLKDLKKEEDMEKMKGMSEPRFKKMVKIKICEFALDQLNEEKFSHSKMDNLVFTELKLQDYQIREKWQ